MSTTTESESRGFSRFHAIISAKPVSVAPSPLVPQSTSSGQWNIRFEPAQSRGKRKREVNASEAGQRSEAAAKKSATRPSDSEGHTPKELVVSYQAKEDLLAALATHFKETSDVNFLGTYKHSETESGMTHKQRIQTICHDIWKATGYRFTVKDHPQVTNGHKTRFWCSQDEAHRSKSSRAARKSQGEMFRPRTTSTGEAMAKNRYPCRSRLLISSKDSDTAGLRITTIRMHHHLTHEPYVDTSLPPELAHSLLESMGWVVPSSSSPLISNFPSPLSNMHLLHDAPCTSSDNEPMHLEDDNLPPSDHLNQAAEASNSGQTPTVATLPPRPKNLAMFDQNIFQHRMSAHIKNLREFCDGLEYQLQFNDFRILEELESTGGSFLTFVEQCLRKEGRLTAVEQASGSNNQFNTTSDSDGALR